MSGRPFRAFVSYCHADRGFASAIQRKLETYRLPRRLAGLVEPLPGQARGRIGPIFRDRADLSAAQSLTDAVCEAIAASSALVVIASPDAARSIWVEREIALFRDFRRAGAVEERQAPLPAQRPLLMGADFNASFNGTRTR